MLILSLPTDTTKEKKFLTGAMAGSERINTF
jgi:hypothetical protein